MSKITLVGPNDAVIACNTNNVLQNISFKIGVDSSVSEVLAEKEIGI